MIMQPWMCHKMFTSTRFVGKISCKTLLHVMYFLCWVTSYLSLVPPPHLLGAVTTLDQVHVLTTCKGIILLLKDLCTYENIRSTINNIKLKFTMDNTQLHNLTNCRLRRTDLPYLSAWPYRRKTVMLVKHKFDVYRRLLLNLSHSR